MILCHTILYFRTDSQILLSIINYLRIITGASLLRKPCRTQHLEVSVVIGISNLHTLSFIKSHYVQLIRLTLIRS